MTSECSLLEQTLSANLSWNRARIKFLSRFLLALFAARTANLTRIAVLFAGHAKVESNYKRIKRFLAFFEMDAAEITRLLVKLMNLQPPFILSIDRTEWRLGTTWVNVLMLSAVWEGVAIPIVWTVFQKKGCSSDSERRAIVEKYLQIFGAETIKFVTADREFASREWLDYLSTNRIDFVLRIKSSAFITDKRGKQMRASKLLQSTAAGEKLICRRQRKMCGITVSVAGVRKADGDNVIVISSIASSDRALSNYCLRWQIETLFGCLKTRGFNLEETHVTAPERVSRLLALLALGFCWALLSGKLVCERKALRTKKHKRLEMSVFRAGLDCLGHLFGCPANEEQKQVRQQFILLLYRT
jgi:hypothetical protein